MHREQTLFCKLKRKWTGTLNQNRWFWSVLLAVEDFRKKNNNYYCLRRLVLAWLGWFYIEFKNQVSWMLIDGISCTTKTSPLTDLSSPVTLTAYCGLFSVCRPSVVAHTSHVCRLIIPCSEKRTRRVLLSAKSSVCSLISVSFRLLTAKITIFRLDTWREMLHSACVF